jgi:NAD(P)-dependent dehydrogenase (short-subunit alcohol dehydrogenase family)
LFSLEVAHTYICRSCRQRRPPNAVRSGADTIVQLRRLHARDVIGVRRNEGLKRGRRDFGPRFDEARLMAQKKTAIITGASGGIGSGLVRAFLAAGYNVVATALDVNKAFEPAPNLILVEGDIGDKETAVQAVGAAIENFAAIDVLVTTAGIFITKRFTEFTDADISTLISINLLGFIFIAQLAVAEMLKQGAGSVVSITAALADNPIAGVNASVPMITKGGLNAVIRSLAIEYAHKGIRFNAVAPGVVDTPMHANDPQDELRKLQPMGKFASVQDIVDAVLYVADAAQVTGEILHVDGGAHVGRW